MNVLSLFSGYSGLDMGLGMVFPDARTVMFCEIEEYPARILERRYPDVPIWKDVYTLDGRMFSEEGVEVDVITAGFPCQPFSHAGKRKGTDDARGILFWEITRIAGEIREAQGRLPMLILENVAGLLSMCDGDGGRVFWTILSDLYEVGYNARWGVVGACHAGAPHKRERVFIIARDSDSNVQGAWRQDEGRQDT